jgi:hypothetical protein
MLSNILLFRLEASTDQIFPQTTSISLRINQTLINGMIFFFFLQGGWGVVEKEGKIPQAVKQHTNNFNFVIMIFEHPNEGITRR